MPFTEDSLKIAGKSFSSRLLLGSAGFRDEKTRQEALFAGGAEIVTAGIRRVGVLERAHLEGYFVLPNTAGCKSAKEAILYAELAREALQTNWIKLEVIGDDKTLYPHVIELLKAASELISLGFVVLPYCTDDPVICRQLEEIGCAALMPLGSPIGSGRGILNPYNFEILRKQTLVPLIIDAGLGSPVDGAIAMELGADAILVNSAIAYARDPVAMAKGFRLCVEGGRLGFLSGPIPEKAPTPSTPKEGKIACTAPC